MKCSFCNSVLKAGRGKMFVKLSGEVLYFCSSKCQKNYELGRLPRQLGWIRKL